MIPLPGLTSDHLTVFAAVVAFFALMAVLRRIPVVRTLVSVLSWLVFAGLVTAVLVQREQFDPWLSQLAGKLNLPDEQKVVGEVTRVPMARDGHFWVRANINGVERRMLVDSGATITRFVDGNGAGSEDRAAAFALSMLIRTANGTISAQPGSLGELRMGNIVARDLAVVMSPAFGNADILGMNFLSRLKSWRVEGRTLILEPNHPQAVE